MSSSKIFFTTIFSPLDGNSTVKTVEKPPRPISSLFLNLKTGIPVKSDEDVLFCIFKYFSRHQTQTFSTKPSYYMFCKQASSYIPLDYDHFHARSVELARRVDAAWILSYKSTHTLYDVISIHPRMASTRLKNVILSPGTT